MRRTIAKRLTDAKQTIPHFYLSTDVVLDRVIALRGDLNRLDEKTPQKLSLNDFFIKAMAMALQRVPQANAVWAEESILRFARSDISVAVSVESRVVHTCDPRCRLKVDRRNRQRNAITH